MIEWIVPYLKLLLLLLRLHFPKQGESLGLGDHRDECVGLCVPPIESADRFFRRLVRTLCHSEPANGIAFRKSLIRKLP